MKVEQASWTEAKGWQPGAPGNLGAAAQLVLAFRGTGVLHEGKGLDDLRRAYPNAHLLGCSTNVSSTTRR
jgi:hypothetical protein